MLEPLNLFLYTWRFLRELEKEEKNKYVKNCYIWFSRISIVLLPTAFLCIVPAFLIEWAKLFYYDYAKEYEKAKHLYSKVIALQNTVETIGPITNLISCLILALVMRHIYKMSKQAGSNGENFTAKSKVNVLVTCSHIVITLAVTVSQSLLINSVYDA